jgi:hypothetical protein
MEAHGHGGSLAARRLAGVLSVGLCTLAASAFPTAAPGDPLALHGDALWRWGVPPLVEVLGFQVEAWHPFGLRELVVAEVRGGWGARAGWRQWLALSAAPGWREVTGGCGFAWRTGSHAWALGVGSWGRSFGGQWEDGGGLLWGSWSRAVGSLPVAAEVLALRDGPWQLAWRLQGSLPLGGNVRLSLSQAGRSRLGGSLALGLLWRSPGGPALGFATNPSLGSTRLTLETASERGPGVRCWYQEHPVLGGTVGLALAWVLR